MSDKEENENNAAFDDWWNNVLAERQMRIKQRKNIGEKINKKEGKTHETGKA